MADPVARSGTTISDWPGLLTNIGPAAPPDVPGAAVEQVNLQVNVIGEMSSRLGIRKVRFDAED